MAGAGLATRDRLAATRFAVRTRGIARGKIQAGIVGTAVETAATGKRCADQVQPAAVAVHRAGPTGGLHGIGVGRGRTGAGEQRVSGRDAASHVDHPAPAAAVLADGRVEFLGQRLEGADVLSLLVDLEQLQLQFHPCRVAANGVLQHFHRLLVATVGHVDFRLGHRIDLVGLHGAHARRTHFGHEGGLHEAAALLAVGAGGLARVLHRVHPRYLGEGRRLRTHVVAGAGHHGLFELRVGLPAADEDDDADQQHDGGQSQQQLPQHVAAQQVVDRAEQRTGTGHPHLRTAFLRRTRRRERRRGGLPRVRCRRRAVAAARGLLGQGKAGIVHLQQLVGLLDLFLEAGQPLAQLTVLQLGGQQRLFHHRQLGFQRADLGAVATAGHAAAAGLVGLDDAQHVFRQPRALAPLDQVAGGRRRRGRRGRRGRADTAIGGQRPWRCRRRRGNLRPGHPVAVGQPLVEMLGVLGAGHDLGDGGHFLVGGQGDGGAFLDQVDVAENEGLGIALQQRDHGLEHVHALRQIHAGDDIGHRFAAPDRAVQLAGTGRRGRLGGARRRRRLGLHRRAAWRGADDARAAHRGRSALGVQGRIEQRGVLAHQPSAGPVQRDEQVQEGLGDRFLGGHLDIRFAVVAHQGLELDQRQQRRTVDSGTGEVRARAKAHLQAIQLRRRGGQQFDLRVQRLVQRRIDAHLAKPHRQRVGAGEQAKENQGTSNQVHGDGIPWCRVCWVREARHGRSAGARSAPRAME